MRITKTSLLILSLLWPLLVSNSYSETSQEPKKEQSQNQLTPGQIALQLTTQAEAPDLVCIKKSGILKVAIVDQGAAPFSFTNKKGELVGVDIELAKALGDALGVKVEFTKTGNYNDVVQQVIDKKIHIGISKLSVTLDRAKKVRFAGKYIDMSKGLLINRLKMQQFKKDKSNSIREVLNQPGAVIGVLAKSAYEDYARNLFPKTQVKTYETWDQVIEAMRKGEVLAAFRDEWEIRKTLDEKSDLSLYAEAIYLEGQPDPIQMIVPWNANQLAHFIDMFIMLNPNHQYDVPKLFAKFKEYKNQ